MNIYTGNKIVIDNIPFVETVEFCDKYNSNIWHMVQEDGFISSNDYIIEKVNSRTYLKLLLDRRRKSIYVGYVNK